MMPALDSVTAAGDCMTILGAGEGVEAKNFCSTVFPMLYAVVTPPPKRLAIPKRETMATIGVTLIVKLVANRVCLWVRKFLILRKAVAIGWLTEILIIGAG